MELIELGTMLKMTKGKKPIKQSLECLDGYLPYVDIRAFETGDVYNYTDGHQCVPCEEGDVLIVCDGSRSGLVGRAIKGYVGSTLAKISALGLDAKYLFYYIQSKYALLNTNKKGTGTPHLNVELLKKSRLIVLNILEQQRIVSSIEELLTEVDKAVETLQIVKQQLIVYRQAVLEEAFSGKLTNCTAMSSISLSDMVQKIDGLRRGPFGSSIKKAFFVHNGFKVYEQGNAINDDPYRGNYYINQEKYDELINFGVKPHDLLVSCSGVSLGRIVELPDDAKEGVINQALLRIRLNSKIITTRYFVEYFRSDLFQRKIFDKSQGSAMPNLVGIKEFREITMSVPFTIEEQNLIVNEIESRLSLCDSIEQAVNTALTQAAALRQSIYKQAFEGGLT